jgi:hypothetical protein
MVDQVVVANVDAVCGRGKSPGMENFCWSSYSALQAFLGQYRRIGDGPYTEDVTKNQTGK